MMTGPPPLSVGMWLTIASVISSGKAASTGMCGKATCVGGSSTVCGFDTITGYFRAFADSCSMLQENQCHGSNWEISHAGSCRPDESDSYCRPDQLPVCGHSLTVGYKTFTNKCFLTLETAGSGRGDYVLAHDGRCSVPDGRPSGCPVTISNPVYQPICAFSKSSKTFITFQYQQEFPGLNRCNFDYDYIIIHSGECTSQELANDCSRTPSSVSSPICAVSSTLGYKTYTNLEVFAYDLTCNSVDYTLTHTGQCSVPDGPLSGCPVTSSNAAYQPVCAFSQSSRTFTTFQNQPQFAGLNRCNYDNDFILVHTGVCTAQELANDCSRTPSSVSSPVCAVSPTLGYKTYTNQDVLFYDLACNSVDYTLTHTGQCSASAGLVSGCPVTFTNSVYQPICAFSKSSRTFTTFQNEQQFPVLNQCNYDNDFVLVHTGVCTAQELANDCSRTPSSVSSPVCAVSPTLGYKTYTNQDVLFYDLACNSVDYTLTHTGQCSAPDGPVSGCPVTFTNTVNQPICAFSQSSRTFTTFQNQPQFAGLNRCNYDNDFILVHTGVCTTQELANDCSRTPSSVSSPVCAVSPTLGYKTYTNQDVLFYDLACNSVDYTLTHTGQCSAAAGLVSGCPVTFTNSVYQPICAFSKSSRTFTTFQNQQQFPGLNQCNYDNDFVFVHSGVCTTQELGNDCSRTPSSLSGSSPICAVSPTLGYKTYTSLEVFVYDLTCNSVDYTLTHTGRCSVSDGIISTCPLSYSTVYSPVCAFSQSSKNFKTFQNQQQLDSQNICVYDKDYQFSHIGECSGDETQNNCQRSCFQSYEPICAVSPTLGYKTYSNRCFFILDLSCANTDYSIAHSGKCRVQDGPVGGCPANIPQVFSPVCAFSVSSKTFQTFQSQPQLDADNKCTYDNDYLLVHAGQCTTDETGNSCQRGCPRTFDPVCGLSPTKGQKTFDNICTFVFDITCNGGDYAFTNDGTCSNEGGSSSSGCSVSCSSKTSNPVCGYSPSRGYNTFSSPCQWQKENTCYNGDFNFAHDGDCSKEELGKKCHQQNCPTIYKPVCAYSRENGYRTFPSICELETFTKCRGPADYSLSHNGKCTPKELDGACNHDCPLVYEGICGKSRNGYKTFANECFMDRENSCANSDYLLSHSGKCTVSETGKKCKRVCKYIYTPICGKSKSKGYKTFANFCLLDRENSCFYEDFAVAHQGECYPQELCVNCNN